ncbi:serine/threonine protein kinase, partial [Micromonospora sp. HK10]
PADIPPHVRVIVERAMAKDPAARWPSAAALASVARQTKLALSQQARGGRPISGVPASPAAPTARAQVPAAPRPQQQSRPPVAA